MACSIPPLDTQWIEVTSKQAALRLEKLDTDLKNYKANSIKECIRSVLLSVNEFACFICSIRDFVA